MPKIALWVPLEAVLERFGALLLLGLSWALLGPLVAFLRLRNAIESEKARKQNTLMLLRLLIDVGFLAASWGGSVATWGYLGVVLRPLGASWKPGRAILEVILGALTPRDPLSRSRGRGYGEG